MALQEGQERIHQIETNVTLPGEEAEVEEEEEAEEEGKVEVRGIVPIIKPN